MCYFFYLTINATINLSGGIMKLINDIYKFISNLNFVDIFFLVALIVLLILLVTLIYFIKINKEVLQKVEEKEQNKDNIKRIQNSVEKIENNMVNNIDDNEKEEPIDLESFTKKLKEDADKSEESCNLYEKEQEEKAIISYEELVKTHDKYALNYENEEHQDDLTIKKVNLNNFENENKSISDKVKVIISYEKEEAFLESLKELNKLLN